MTYGPHKILLPMKKNKEPQRPSLEPSKRSAGTTQAWALGFRLWGLGLKVSRFESATAPAQHQAFKISHVHQACATAKPSRPPRKACAPDCGEAHREARGLELRTFASHELKACQALQWSTSNMYGRHGKSVSGDIAATDLSSKFQAAEVAFKSKLGS